MKYAFIQAHRDEFRLSSMCRVLKVHRSGYYAWLKTPLSPRSVVNQSLSKQIRHFYDLSNGIYGRPSLGAPNQLQRQFTYEQPDQAWVTDITYIRTYEGWLYLAVVIDLHSRAVVGWSMKKSLETKIILDALMMAMWRRKPDGEVIIHSDQGSQFGSDEFNRWCKDNRLSPSMCRRGNCWDNAVAEAFFSNLKSEQIKRKIYPSRTEAKAEIFEYIGGFYNRVRRHKRLNQLSTLEFEKRQIAL